MHFQTSKAAGTTWQWVLIPSVGSRLMARGDGPFLSEEAALADLARLNAYLNVPVLAPPIGLLTQADVVPLGYYDIDTSLSVGWNAIYGQGLGLRYVSGEPRLLHLIYPDTGKPLCLLELAFPNAFGGTMRETNRWNLPFGPNSTEGRWCGIKWDEARQLLWTVEGIDYPDAANAGNTLSIRSRVLNADHTISDLRGPWGFAGVSQRCICGGIVDVPQTFQAAYDVGPLAVGFGGYDSLMLEGGTVSLGPFLKAFNDPRQMVPGNILGVSLMDCRSGTGNPAWYPAAQAPTSYDRGVRRHSDREEYDSWTSPAPDGLGRWTWGDYVGGAAVWTSRGLLMLPSFGTGRTWYENSTLHSEGRAFEFHVHDPSRLGEVAQGKRAVWDVKPSSIWEVQLEGFGAGQGGNGPAGNVAGLVHDTVASRLYGICPQVNGLSQGQGRSRVFVWHLAA